MLYNKKVLYWWGKPYKKINFWVTIYFICLQEEGRGRQLVPVFNPPFFFEILDCIKPNKNKSSWILSLLYLKIHDPHDLKFLTKILTETISLSTEGYLWNIFLNKISCREHSRVDCSRSVICPRWPNKNIYLF